MVLFLNLCLEIKNCENFSLSRLILDDKRVLIADFVCLIR